jgi:hypothetical protein
MDQINCESAMVRRWRRVKGFFKMPIVILKTVYEEYLKYPNDEEFDPEFTQLLQILYMFGWYHPEKPSKWRIAYGVFVFVFTLVSSFVGFARYSGSAIYKGDLPKGLFLAAAALSLIAFMMQVVFYAFKSKKLDNHIRKLHLRREYYDDDSNMEGFSQKCSRNVKIYKYFVFSTAIIATIFPLVGFNIFPLIYPTFYDDLAVGFLYYPLTFTSAIALYVAAATVVACDMIPILCLLRIIKNQQILASQIRHCADSVNKVENEETIKIFNRYYMKIRE